MSRHYYPNYAAILFKILVTILFIFSGNQLQYPQPGRYKDSFFIQNNKLHVLYIIHEIVAMNI